MTVAGESHHGQQRQIAGTGQTRSQWIPLIGRQAHRHGMAPSIPSMEFSGGEIQPHRCAALPRKY
ncbi:hypothetical protein CR47_0225510 [Ralstonia solanacearum]|nr:hypothetical protein CCY86_18475 [Ralstonia solanacearum]KEI34514.1 hypothetical protein CQ06_00185 [Ralstonia solanacearum]KFZ91539.1 hypothetical protein CR47_0225510 [Ralstonia solanacearum]OCQ57848.1 hypothetical protein AR463_08070 [Ralstonia solanacearum]OCQ72100.1 hypothetical protein AR464_21630 [Ralstonia solanacearum]